MLKTKKLKEMVDYQQGSIVSRTVVDRETGTVSLFVFDAGQNDEHLLGGKT